jgi:hypothetical protein
MHVSYLVLTDIALQNPQDKALELAVAFSQSLSQWAYIVLGGSVAVLLKDLKSRPKDKIIRHSFWAFIPGWVLLASSIYQGIRVQERYVSRWMNQNPNMNDVILKFNRHTFLQIQFMEWGLLIFGIWLVVFLLRWIFHQEELFTDMGLDEI